MLQHSSLVHGVIVDEVLIATLDWSGFAEITRGQVTSHDISTRWTRFCNCPDLLHLPLTWATPTSATCSPFRKKLWHGRPTPHHTRELRIPYLKLLRREIHPQTKKTATRLRRDPVTTTKKVSVVLWRKVPTRRLQVGCHQGSGRDWAIDRQMYRETDCLKGIHRATNTTTPTRVRQKGGNCAKD